jgi:hypothetical protein
MQHRGLNYLGLLGPLALLLGALVLTGCGKNLAIPTPYVQKPVPVLSQAGSVSISPKYAAVGISGTTQYTATVAGGGGSILWRVNGVQGGNPTVGTITANGLYQAPTSYFQAQNVTIEAQLASSPVNNYAQAMMSLIATGVVSPTTNPQVAEYSINLPTAGSVTVNFGKTSSYGFPTWAQSTSSPTGAAVSVFVAGMTGSSLYHMTGQVTLSDGATFTDSDHTFTTGKTPVTPAVIASAMNAGSPQPGIQLFDTALPQAPAMAFTTDLSGNVLWTYTFTGTPEDIIQPIKMLSNGNFLVQIAYLSSIPLHQGQTILPGTLDELREIDLVGNTVESVTAPQVIASLSANSALSAQLSGVTLTSLHHDVLPLPNGHIVLLFSGLKTIDVSPAINNHSGPTNVLGDILVDVDQNFKPDWVWNGFTHLDPQRAPWPTQYPDYTHSNAVLYSSDDGNLLLSVRHQNWIVKIDFADATGSGNILWRLGEGGDFTLVGGTDPTDWFYAQHGPNFFSTNTTGIFTLGVMDNGDDRVLPGVPVGNCPAAGVSTPATAQCYSTASVLQINESARTATLTEHYQPNPPVYSFFGGDVFLLNNGDREVDFASPLGGAAYGTPRGGSIVQELRGAPGQEQVVWQATTPGYEQYRVQWLPSMYPGVQW